MAKQRDSCRSEWICYRRLGIGYSPAIGPGQNGVSEKISAMGKNAMSLAFGGFLAYADEKARNFRINFLRNLKPSHPLYDSAEAHAARGENTAA
jgi:hypothetical protein